jgi:hypothetical protein
MANFKTCGSSILDDCVEAGGQYCHGVLEAGHFGPGASGR